MKLKIILKHFFVFVLHLITLIISIEFMKGSIDSQKNLTILILFCLIVLRHLSLYVLNGLPINIFYMDNRKTWITFIIYVLVDIPPCLYYLELFDLADKFGNFVFYGIHLLIARARKIVTKFHNYSYEIVMSLVIVNSCKNVRNSYQIVK